MERGTGKAPPWLGLSIFRLRWGGRSGRIGIAKSRSCQAIAPLRGGFGVSGVWCFPADTSCNTIRNRAPKHGGAQDFQKKPKESYPHRPAGSVPAYSLQSSASPPSSAQAAPSGVAARFLLAPADGSHPRLRTSAACAGLLEGRLAPEERFFPVSPEEREEVFE
jgi:hypothetical protein